MGKSELGGVLAARALREEGVEAVFALPGGHNLPLFEGARLTGLRLVDSRHEENAVMMAEGYALASGRVGVASVTAGPGLTNALPGIAEAHQAGVPVVVISGRTGLAQRGREAVQDLDQMSIVAPVTKWRDQCLQPERIPAYVRDAVHQAHTGAPGVAYLEIPQDVFGMSAAPLERPWPAGHPDARGTAVAGEVARAVEVLAGASRPVVLAGSGAFFSGAGPALSAFVERTGIPVTTTSAARGLLDDDHPRCLGGLVHGGIALASSDAVLVLGSRFNANLLWGGAPLFPPEGRVVQVDVRPENLGGERRPDVGLVGDVAAVLDSLTGAWTADAGRFDGWADQARGGAAISLESWEAQCERPAEDIHPGWLARECARFAAEAWGDAYTTVSDGGDSVLWGVAFFRARGPGRCLYIGSALGTLGIGLPFGIGARVAREEPVLVFTGDGAFGLSAMELDTAARHRLPIVTVVVNNGGWGDVRHEQRAFYGHEADTGAVLSEMRYDLLAEAVGGHGEVVKSPEELRPALDRAAAFDGPSVVNVHTDPEVMSDLMKNLGGLGVM
ncbi:MAG: thiamine pyrophosphate-binding protein [Actinobacteria bacterium]|nr:thiamine pyrophosphate-binding protein [Actinomycetota bacterium]